MRKIKDCDSYSKIANIRIHIFEYILTQLSNGKTVDFSENIYLNRIEKLSKKKVLLIEIVSNISQTDAKKCLEIYILQDKEIRNNIFSVTKILVPCNVIRLVEFIYENILFYSTYWKGIDNTIFSKMIFKKNFFKYQWHCVCPYCDSKEDTEFLDFEIDHLLPKSEFPLLYINEFNLFPCCTSCNHNYYWKWNHRNEKYYNLFNNCIWLKVQFEFEPQFRITWIDSISNDFLDLIKLWKRTRGDMFSNKIETLKKKIFKDLKINKKNETLLDINSAYYFLSKAIYQYYLADIKKYLI